MGCASSSNGDLPPNRTVVDPMAAKKDRVVAWTIDVDDNRDGSKAQQLHGEADDSVNLGGGCADWVIFCGAENDARERDEDAAPQEFLQQLDVKLETLRRKEANAALQSFDQSGHTVSRHDDGAQPLYRASNGQNGSSERRPSVRDMEPWPIDADAALLMCGGSSVVCAGGDFDCDADSPIERDESFKTRRPEKIDTSMFAKYNTVARERRKQGGGKRAGPLFYLEEPAACAL